jgi:hypothetical protein
MLKRSGAVARAIVIAGLSCGLVGAVGEAAAQGEGAKKGDTMMKTDEKSMPMKDGQKGDGMKNDGMKNDGMKRGDPRQDGTTQKMGDKMKDDTMTKEKR